MTDEYAQDFAASHASLAKVRAKMPRAVKYHSGGEAPPATQPPTVVAEPHASAPSLAVGDVASCTMGIWTGEPTAYAYQWLRNGLQIFSAQASDYSFAVDDVGAMINCRVSPSNAAGSSEAVSNALGPVVEDV